MRLTDLLPTERVAIHRRRNDIPLDKAGALKAISCLLAVGTRIDVQLIERVLSEREMLQSTGIGEGVAIPHGALPALETQHAGLLIVPEGLDFVAIDAQPVNIVFAVIGPKRATGEHLKTLARVSRLLRNQAFRARLIAAPDARTAHDLVVAEEGEHP
ncbi:MAG: PTS sugar transporter subunit IIA [Polyangiaceae bacterium]